MTITENLEIYNLDGDLISIKNRKEFYSEIRKEFKENGKITKKVKTIRVLLLNSSGRIYLQKRSNIKTENPGMYDKTVGGHVSAGDSFELTAIRECAEELGFPMTIINENEFEKSIKNTDLNIIGIFKQVDYIETFNSIRKNSDGTQFIQPQITSIYIGYYDGPIKFVDGECSGIEVFSLNELENEINENPDKFTEDLKIMIKKYKNLLKN